MDNRFYFLISRAPSGHTCHEIIFVTEIVDTSVGDIDKFCTVGEIINKHNVCYAPCIQGMDDVAADES